MRIVLPIVFRELDFLSQAYHKPYDFLVSQLSSAQSETGKYLVEIFTQHKGLIEGLLKELPILMAAADLGFEQNPVVKDVKMGILYMFDNKRRVARSSFAIAEQSNNSQNLYPSLEKLSRHFDEVYKTFMGTYSRIQLAREIGTNGQKI